MKIISLCCAMLLTLSVTGCAADASEDAAREDQPTQEEANPSPELDDEVAPQGWADPGGTDQNEQQNCKRAGRC